MLVLGDTNSCLAVIPAKRRKIPVFHMEAGNRCFDQRVPEEINRRIVDHTADVNLTYSYIAREYLLREGLPPDRVIKTGSPMFEVLHALSAEDRGVRRARSGSSSRPSGYLRRQRAPRGEHRFAERSSPGSSRSSTRVADDYGLPVIVSHPSAHAEAHRGAKRCMFDPQVRAAQAARLSSTT